MAIVALARSLRSRRCTCARCGSCARRGVARAALAQIGLLAHRRSALWAIAPALARSTRSATTLLTRAHGPAPADRRPRRRRCCCVGLRNPVLAFFLPRPVLVPLARSRWLRGGVPRACASRSWRCPSTCSCSTAGTSRSSFEARRAPPARARAPARVLHRRRRAACGGRCSSPSGGGCAGELWKIGHILGGADDRRCSSGWLRAHPRADLHRRLRQRRPRDGIDRAGRPADRRRR